MCFKKMKKTLLSFFSSLPMIFLFRNNKVGAYIVMHAFKFLHTLYLKAFDEARFIKCQISFDTNTNLCPHSFTHFSM